MRLHLVAILHVLQVSDAPGSGLVAFIHLMQVPAGNRQVPAGNRTRRLTQAAQPEGCRVGREALVIGQGQGWFGQLGQGFG